MNSLSFELQPGTDVVVTEEEHMHYYSTERNIHLCQTCEPDEHGPLTSDDCYNRELRTFLVNVSTDSPYVMAGGFTVEASDIEEAAMVAERMLSESVQPSFRISASAAASWFGSVSRE